MFLLPEQTIIHGRWMESPNPATSTWTRQVAVGSPCLRRTPWASLRSTRAACLTTWTLRWLVGRTWSWLCYPSQVLGCAILLKFCDLLHASLFYSNSETVDWSRIAPARSGTDCSLLLSVTDLKLPLQPSSDVRYWFPPDGNLKQPQTDEVIRAFPILAQESASSQCLPKSADLEALLAATSVDDLKDQCQKLYITPFGKLNRLQMAESILFHQFAAKSSESATRSRAHVNSGPQPDLNGKVVCHGLMCCDRADTSVSL